MTEALWKALFLNRPAIAIALACIGVSIVKHYDWPGWWELAQIGLIVGTALGAILIARWSEARPLTRLWKWVKGEIREAVED
jgi:hypothetical protein